MRTVKNVDTLHKTIRVLTNQISNTLPFHWLESTLAEFKTVYSTSLGCASATLICLDTRGPHPPQCMDHTHPSAWTTPTTVHGPHPFQCVHHPHPPLTVWVRVKSRTPFTQSAGLANTGGVPHRNSPFEGRHTTLTHPPTHTHTATHTGIAVMCNSLTILVPIAYAIICVNTGL